MRTILFAVAALVFGAAPSVASAEDVLAAREHFKRGTTAYDLGRYVEAAHEYELAYEAKDEPDLLFNIGQAYRLAGDNVRAIRAYKSFLRRVPNSPSRGVVEEKVAELQKIEDAGSKVKQGPPEGTLKPQSSQLQAAPSATPREATASSIATQGDPMRAPTGPRPWYRYALGWGVTGSGAAVAIVGAGLLGQSAVLTSAAAQAETQSQHDAGINSAGPYRWSGVALVSIGGAIMIGGVVAFALHQRRSR